MNELGRKKDDKEYNGTLFTKETLGVVLILFATLCLVCLITREKVFSLPGQYVNAFLLGLFGFFSYAVLIFAIVMGVILVSGKKTGLSPKRKALVTLAFLAIAIISHVATISSEGLSYGEYLVNSYNMGAGGIATSSGGGICTAIIAYAFSSLLTSVGSYVILGIITAIVGYFLVIDWIKAPSFSAGKKSNKKFKSSYVEEKDQIELDVDIEGEKEYPALDVDFSSQKPKQQLFVNNPQDFALKNKREINREASNPTVIKLESYGKINVGSYGADVNGKGEKKISSEYKSKLDYIKTPASIDMNKFKSEPTVRTTGTTVSDYITPSVEDVNSDIPFIEHVQEENQIEVDDSASARAKAFGDRYADAIETDEVAPIVEKSSDTVETFKPVDLSLNREIEKETQVEEKKEDIEIPFIEEIADQASEKVYEEKVEETPEPTILTSSRRIRDIFGTDKKEEEPKEEKKNFTSRVTADDNGSRRGTMFSQPIEEEPVEEETPPPINREYFRPPFDLLETYAQSADDGKDNHEERMEIIQQTLEEFKINATTQSYVQGPTVTRYEIMMPAGISVKKVLAYDDDLKMRLASREGIRIEAPIPGKNLVGVEVANNVKVTVGLKEVMEGMAGKKSKPGSLMFALGKDIVGNSISDDLAKGPHFLIAGSTGSGKSVCLHVMIVSLLMRYSPEELKIVLIDPKCVEFRKYEHIPHLLVDEIITEPKRAITLLHWAYEETTRRNELFTSCGGMISNIDDYNSQIANDTIPKLPKIVFIIDELADLMETCKKDLEEKIRRIAAKARSAGIHLVLATQRPSVDVVTGTIKANLPSRIALKVMNFADSQTILSEAGAEKLLGNGDMLYKNSSMANHERYQGAFISPREITNVVNYIKEHNTAYFDKKLQTYLDNESKPKQEESATTVDSTENPNEVSDIFLKALWLAVTSGGVSISQLQRRFQIGYARAGGIIDKMETMGYISPNEGSKARKVYLTKEQFEERYGNVSDIE